MLTPDHVFLNPLKEDYIGPPRVDPRNIQIGERVCLRGSGRGGSQIDGYGRVFDGMHSEYISIVNDLGQSVFYFFWNVGTLDYHAPALRRLRKSLALKIHVDEYLYRPGHRGALEARDRFMVCLHLYAKFPL